MGMELGAPALKSTWTASPVSTKCLCKNIWARQTRYVVVILHDNCNAGVVYSDEKGSVLNMFNMWLVRSGIANLPSISCLELKVYRVTYDMHGNWHVHYTNGRVLKFERNVQVCMGFPYIGLENL